ncbi:MAG: DUF2135 domain-containing protein [Tannerellaceae bacterium]|nr:DUF2135 domain-containing protein [Tannerellaceae bacterium]
MRLFEERKKWWKGVKHSYDTSLFKPTEEWFEYSDIQENVSNKTVPPPTQSFIPQVSDEIINIQNDEPVVMEMLAVVEEYTADYSSMSTEMYEEEPERKPTDSTPTFTHLYPSPDFISTIRLEEKLQQEKYIKVFNTIAVSNYYSTYLELRKGHRDNPAFYTDVATLFRQKGLKGEAFLILSNLAELELENHKLLRGLGYYLLQWNYTEPAIFIFERVKELRPEEAQSLRDLTHAYKQHAEYQRAVDLLYDITLQPWDDRFPEIEVIAVTEMNEIIMWAEQKKKKVKISHIDSRLLENLPVDIRIVVGWSTDNTDIDLWVTDPLGETCKYSNRSTRIRGTMSRDFTQGFGPEEFMLKQAIKGTYTIHADYFGSHEQTLKEPVMIYMDIYTRYSQTEEKKESLIFRLSKEKEFLTLGTIEIK